MRFLCQPTLSLWECIKKFSSILFCKAASPSFPYSATDDPVFSPLLLFRSSSLSLHFRLVVALWPQFPDGLSKSNDFVDYLAYCCNGGNNAFSSFLHRGTAGIPPGIIFIKRTWGSLLLDHNSHQFLSRRVLLLNSLNSSLPTCLSISQSSCFTIQVALSASGFCHSWWHIQTIFPTLVTLVPNQSLDLCTPWFYATPREVRFSWTQHHIWWCWDF